MTAQAASQETTLSREEEQAEVIRRLEEDIIFGRFAPGSRLVEELPATREGLAAELPQDVAADLEGVPLEIALEYGWRYLLAPGVTEREELLAFHGERRAEILRQGQVKRDEGTPTADDLLARFRAASFLKRKKRR